MSEKKPRLDWNHTDACTFLMSDPESDTYHASRYLLDQIVALEAENAELRDQYTAYLKTANESTVKAQNEAARQYAAFVDMRNRRDLELANAEHAKASEQEAWGERDKLKARLAWFEKFEAEVRKGVAAEAESNGFDCAWPWHELADWEREHPKPE